MVNNMEKKFVKVRSVKDIAIFFLLIITGCFLASISEFVGVNIIGFALIISGFIFAFVLRDVYKDVETGEKYLRKELLFKPEMKCAILSVIGSAPETITLSEEGKGQVVRLEIYYGKSSGKAYLQLFEYIPHQYEPCSEMYEYDIDKVKELIK